MGMNTGLRPGTFISRSLTGKTRSDLINPIWSIRASPSSPPSGWFDAIISRRPRSKADSFLPKLFLSFSLDPGDNIYPNSLRIALMKAIRILSLWLYMLSINSILMNQPFQVIHKKSRLKISAGRDSSKRTQPPDWSAFQGSSSIFSIIMQN